MKGYITFDGDRITDVHEGEPPDGCAKALILPAFVNAHTHIGDAAAYPAPRRSVEELVAPPEGYKHRFLQSKSDEEKLAGMRWAITEMAESGTALFGDFREEGLRGVELLRRALDDSGPRVVVFGRPAGTSVSEEEVDALVSACDGIGMSSIADWPYELVEMVSEKAHRAGKVFALHASEARREDIASILDLRPAFLVHMCKASDDDVRAAVDEGVPIVVCPRSNMFFGLDPGIPRLLKAGANVALGTDNCMISKPDMIEELKAAYSSSLPVGGVDPSTLLSLATANARKVLNAKAKITTELDAKSDLVAVRARGDDPLRWLVTEASSKDVIAVGRGGVLRRTSSWTR
ncbi:MAG: amidohydrolase family protein [Thermoplasmata archaeon]